MIGWKPGNMTAETVTAKLTKAEGERVLAIPTPPPPPTFVVVTRRWVDALSWSKADTEQEARRRCKTILETEGGNWPLEVSIYRGGDGSMQWLYSESRCPQN